MSPISHRAHSFLPQKTRRLCVLQSLLGLYGVMWGNLRSHIRYGYNYILYRMQSM